MSITMKKALFILFFLFLLPALILAHPGHNNPWVKEGREMRKDEAITYCKELVGKLVDEGKLDKSWRKASVKKAEKQTFGETEHLEWVIIFYNKSEPNPEHHSLYFFLSLYGEVVGANFTGE